MTLKQIAEEAGVSISTVSRVINQKNAHAATQELQNKIWEIARRTGYTPSSAAQALKSGAEKSKPLRSIACLYARDNVSITDNPYFTGIALSFEKEALKANYSVQCSFTAFDLSNTRVDSTFLNSNIDGIMIIGRHDWEIILYLRKRFHHIVYAGLNPPAKEKYDTVICNAYQIGYHATKYLIDNNHRHIAYIGDTMNEARFQGYRAALHDADIDYNDSWFFQAHLSMHGGYCAAEQLLAQDPRPTAVFCMNDHVAIGAMRTIQDAGVKIPRDISVIGVDDIEAAQYSLPKLTTIHTPMEELGSIAAKILIDRISKGHTINMNVSLPFFIVERDSCAVYKGENK